MVVYHGGMAASHKRRAAIAIGIAAFLLLPLTAMQFTEEVAWTPSDFAIAFALLGGAGVLYEVAAWRSRSITGRRIAATAIIAAVTVIWAHGAVGIF